MAASAAAQRPSKKLSAADRATEARASLLDEQGVVVVPSALQPQTAAALRACCVSERELYHAKVEADPELSPTYFNVPVQSHDPRRGYLLLPWREAGRGVDALGEALGEGPILDAMREALGEGAPLGDLFAKMCGGEPAKLWDFFALRTEAGAQRQQIHADTPYQKVPPLFCAFIALQDITLAMGPTCFIPGTHKRTAMRKQFDNGLFDGGRSEMLAAARAEYALLSAGDAAFFDMRTLHAGMENLAEEDGGAPRYYLVLTFLNPNAKKQSVDEIGHRSNMRPGYVGLYTLGDVRRENLRGTATAACPRGRWTRRCRRDDDLLFMCVWCRGWLRGRLGIRSCHESRRELHIRLLRPTTLPYHFYDAMDELDPRGTRPRPRHVRKRASPNRPSLPHVTRLLHREAPVLADLHRRRPVLVGLAVVLHDRHDGLHARLDRAAAAVGGARLGTSRCAPSCAARPRRDRTSPRRVALRAVRQLGVELAAPARVRADGEVRDDAGLAASRRGTRADRSAP